MNVQSAECNGFLVRFIEGPRGELFLNTKDVCGVLGITEHIPGGVLDRSSLDLASAVNVAMSHGDETFSEWLLAQFAG